MTRDDQRAQMGKSLLPQKSPAALDFTKQSQFTAHGQLKPVLDLIWDNRTSPQPVTDIILKREPARLWPAGLAAALNIDGGRARFLADGGERNMIDWIRFNNPAVEIAADDLMLQEWESYAEPCTDTQKQALDESEAIAKKIIVDHEPYATSKVGERVFAERDRRTAALEKGEPIEGIAPSRDDLLRDSVQRTNAVNSFLVKHCHGVIVPLATPIIRAFERRAAMFLRAQEHYDREECAALGLVYAPSTTYKAAVVIFQKYTVENLIPKPNTWALPSTILANLIY